jgi:murein L,D-transpeptidase YcbB/YkuD
LFPSFSYSTRSLLARVGPLVGPVAGAAIALAACAPAEPAILAADLEPPAALVAAPVSVPPAPMAAVAKPDAKPEPGELFGDSLKAVVAGERLNVELLRRFYARRGFQPVWPTRQAQADSLMKALLRAGDHGLAPELFHADSLKSTAPLAPLDRELLLSDAFLSYADALARGAVPIERRRDDEVLTPEPIDVAAVLDAAIDSPDPAAVIEALAPMTPTYRQLRLALQVSRADSLLGGSTAPTRLRAIKVGLERERWLPRRLAADRVWVNVADERLAVYRDDRVEFSARVVVGRIERRNQSPELQATIERILFNPPWNIPEDIVTHSILPKARQDPNYLAQNNMVMLPDGMLQQRAGPGSALGQFLFEMNNRFDVYLHDTPSKDLFGREGRRFSAGCIRVENAQQLAALLMQQPLDAIKQTTATGDTIRRDLPQPVPVFLVYQTAFADSEGRLQFREDVYGRDAAIWQHLDPAGRAVAGQAVAGLAAPGQRGSKAVSVQMEPLAVQSERKRAHR